MNNHITFEFKQVIEDGKIRRDEWEIWAGSLYIGCIWPMNKHGNVPVYFISAEEGNPSRKLEAGSVIEAKKLLLQKAHELFMFKEDK